jgi:hypothetical protein
MIHFQAFINNLLSIVDTTDYNFRIQDLKNITSNDILNTIPIGSNYYDIVDDEINILEQKNPQLNLTYRRANSTLRDYASLQNNNGDVILTKSQYNKINKSKYSTIYIFILAYVLITIIAYFTEK